MSVIIDNWIKCFESRESADFVNKWAHEELCVAFNASIEKDVCRKKLLDYQEVLFLFNKTFGKKMDVFHRITEIGGTV